MGRFIRNVVHNRSKFFLAYALVIILGVLSSVGMVIFSHYNEQNTLLSMTHSLSKTLSLQQIQLLTGTEEDLQSEYYQILKTQLISIKDSHQNMRFAYLMGKNQQETSFFLLMQSLNILASIAPLDKYITKQVKNLFKFLICNKPS